MEQLLIQGVSMRSVFHLRLVNALGTLGAALGAIGFFLPFRTQIFRGTPHGFFAPPYPAGAVLTDSFWQMLVNTIRGGASALYFPLPLESLIIGVFLLSILAHAHRISPLHGERVVGGASCSGGAVRTETIMTIKTRKSSTHSTSEQARTRGTL